jgi:hypothetical protein
MLPSIGHVVDEESAEAETLAQPLEVRTLLASLWAPGLWRAGYLLVANPGACQPALSPRIIPLANVS